MWFIKLFSQLIRQKSPSQFHKAKSNVTCREWKAQNPNIFDVQFSNIIQEGGNPCIWEIGNFEYFDLFDLFCFCLKNDSNY